MRAQVQINEKGEVVIVDGRGNPLMIINIFERQEDNRRAADEIVRRMNTAEKQRRGR